MEKLWQRWLFYIDIIIIAIFVVATVYMANDAFWAGYYHDIDRTKFDIAMWHLARDVAFQTASLSWIFYRLFRCQFLLLKKP